MALKYLESSCDRTMIANDGFEMVIVTGQGDMGQEKPKRNRRKITHKTRPRSPMHTEVGERRHLTNGRTLPNRSGTEVFCLSAANSQGNLYLLQGHVFPGQTTARYREALTFYDKLAVVAECVTQSR